MDLFNSSDDVGSFSLFFRGGGSDSMDQHRPPQLDRWRFRSLLVAISVGTGVLLVVQEWSIPPIADTSYWNGLLAFVLLGIACDSSFLPISRISFARLGTSVAFIPFIASALLF